MVAGEAVVVIVSLAVWSSVAVDGLHQWRSTACGGR